MSLAFPFSIINIAHLAAGCKWKTQSWVKHPYDISDNLAPAFAFIPDKGTLTLDNEMLCSPAVLPVGRAAQGVGEAPPSLHRRETGEGMPGSRTKRRLLGAGHTPQVGNIWRFSGVLFLIRLSLGYGLVLVWLSFGFQKKAIGYSRKQKKQMVFACRFPVAW